MITICAKICVASLLLLLVANNAHSQSCMLNNAELLRQHRIRTMRASILAQLGMTDLTLSSANYSAINQTLVKTSDEDAYYAIRNATVQQRKKQKTSHDFFAETVTTVTGTMTSSQELKHKRSGIKLPQSVLGKFTVHFDLELSRDLTDVIDAELVLFQVPPQMVPGIVIEDQKQYVEIRTINNSTGVTAIIKGEYVDIEDYGYQVFDVTSAVKDNQLNGTVTLEIVIYCFSSLHCNKPVNGKKPARVHFLNESDDSSKAPRIIVTSRNPLEASHGKRYRRQADGVGLCNPDESVCCLKPLSIHFHDDLDSPFVIEPHEFDANYCDGLCPHTSGGDLMTPQIFEYYSKLGDGTVGGSLQPCCSGNTYEDLTVLVNLGGVITSYILHDIKVTSCRCA